MLPQVEQLRALYFAELSMREAAAGADVLCALGEEQHAFSECLFTGVAVAYSRPFGANHGMSRIGAEFEKFDDRSMAALHHTLLEARDTLYAHKDLVREVDGLSPEIDPNEVRKIRIIIDAEGQATWEVRQPRLAHTHGKQIGALCRFQALRMNAASKRMGTYICRGKQYHPGEYVLGEDFP